MSNKNFNKVSEIWSALFDGKKIKGEAYSGYFYLKDGDIYNASGGIADWVLQDLRYPTYWSIYEDPKWYDSIPEQGVLCWVNAFNKDLRSIPAVIVNADKSIGRYQDVNTVLWKYATPVTPEEAENLIYRPEK
jgi:hypothetical protein